MPEYRMILYHCRNCGAPAISMCGVCSFCGKWKDENIGIVMNTLLEKLKHASECGATKIYINRNTQLSLMFMRTELLSMDIEPNFSEKEYVGIPIEVDNTLDDYDVRF